MAGAGRVIIVTGASRGIGYGIGKELALRMPGSSLYLTCRANQHQLTELDNNLKREIGAASDNTRFRHLDVKDDRSIKKFFGVITKKHKMIDILVNNAGRYNKPPHYSTPASVHDKCVDLPLFHKEIKETADTNYFGLKKVIAASVPLLAPHSRIINMTSHMANYNIFNEADSSSAELKRSFQDPGLTVEKLDNLVKKFLEEIKNKTWSDSGWPNCCYSVTKLAVNCYTKLLQEELDSALRYEVKVNAVCSGTTHSKMRLLRSETISVSDSADVIAYLATMRMQGVGDCSIPNDQVPRGKVLWHDLSIIKDGSEGNDEEVHSAKNNV